MLYPELVTTFWFQGAFCLPRQGIIKAFHIIGNSKLEDFLWREDNLQDPNSKQTGEDTELPRTKAFSDLHQKTAKAETVSKK